MHSQPKPLHVRFDPPSEGGITVRLATSDQEFAENFSHIYPTLEQLCAALWDAGRGLASRPVTFYLEPVELELKFHPRESGESSLAIHQFPARERSGGGEQLFACRLSTRALVLEFWRALRRLEASLSNEEFQREWRGAFPVAEMAALSRLVEEWKSAPRSVE